MPSYRTFSAGKGCFLCLLAVALTTPPLLAAKPAGTDRPRSGWPQWGGSPLRNNAPDARNLPAEWSVGEFDFRTGKWLGGDVKNVRWVARLGSESYGSPAVAGGKVFFATNNAGYLPQYPKSTDLGCLVSFRQTDGEFLWQHSVPKLDDREIDWPQQGICCTPLVEGDRLWLVTNRGEVVCLDTEGFRDGENDGPQTNEPLTEHNGSDIVWSYNMMAELGSIQHNMASCSVTSANDLLLVHTSNGVDSSHEKVPAPQAPSFIALEKHSGRLIWADNSPGENILHGQWSSPAYAVLGGVPQAIFPGGDGWLYSFLTQPSADGKPELLWKFDCNPKQSVWSNGGGGDRNTIIATPVIHNGRVYIATGEDPEAGEGPGILWCIDPNRRGDVSPELVVDREGNLVPPRRIQAVDETAGEIVRPNPNSAAIWKYTGHDADGDGELAFEETMHRTLSMAAIRDDLLVIGDFAGLVHCLDLKTGRPHWTYDMLAASWGSPLLADGKIYLGNEDGDMVVFELSPKLNVLAKNNLGNAIYGSAVAVDQTLYVATRTHLFAIAEGAAPKSQ